MQIIFNTTHKISPENALQLPRNRQKTELILSVMTSITMFAKSQNASSSYGFRQYRNCINFGITLNGYIRILAWPYSKSKLELNSKTVELDRVMQKKFSSV